MWAGGWKAEVESSCDPFHRFPGDGTCLLELFTERAGVGGPDVPDLEREVEQAPFGFQEAECGVYVSSLQCRIGSECGDDGVHLLLDAFRECASIPAANINLVVAPPDWAELALDNLALVGLGVHDPHAS
jgi:hypothetical protein